MSSYFAEKLVLGGIYKTLLTQDNVRIISFDDHQVYYDVWAEFAQNWLYKVSLKKKIFFYRCPPDRFLMPPVEFLGVEPFNTEEMRVYRPDLPFAVCRNSKLQWTNKVYPDLADFEKYLRSRSIDRNSLGDLKTAHMILVPFGAKGGHKKSLKINALNGSYFTGPELLWNAHNAQAPYINGELEIGTGLHRLGFEKEIPSYYIGGYYDSGGSLKEE